MATRKVACTDVSSALRISASCLDQSDLARYVNLDDDVRDVSEASRPTPTTTTTGIDGASWGTNRQTKMIETDAAFASTATATNCQT